MDPDANLREQVKLAKEIVEIQDRAKPDGSLDPEQTKNLAHAAFRLADLVESLVDWKIRGGYGPDWKGAVR
jgi:hypothetical protein